MPVDDCTVGGAGWRCLAPPTARTRTRTRPRHPYRISYCLYDEYLYLTDCPSPRTRKLDASGVRYRHIWEAYHGASSDHDVKHYKAPIHP